MDKFTQNKELLSHRTKGETTAISMLMSIAQSQARLPHIGCDVDVAMGWKGVAIAKDIETQGA